MSPTQLYRGQCVSEGTAVGVLYLADGAELPGPATAVAATADQVRSAFAAVAAARAELAERLAAAGRDAEAQIVSVAALIAADPALAGAAVAALDDGADATTAVRQAADDQAAVIAAIPNPELAERASDVRQVGAAVLERLGRHPAPPPAGSFILVRRDAAAADLIELAERGLTGVVSVAGGASSHAAIVARGLGVPMITGLDAAVLAEATGREAILDADAGVLVLDPGQAELAAARTAAAARAGSAGVAGPVRTKDGQPITLLVNVASAAEVRLGLAGGATGAGLIRTEIPFASVMGWPSEADHLAALTPIMDQLAGRVATVRLLDFSGDKVPPFLRDGGGGLAALFAHPSALRWQLRAALAAGQQADLAILVPMVGSVEEIGIVRDIVGKAADELGVRRPPLGIMVEVRSTAAAAERFARRADFFSIGTNDLTSQVLGLDRRNEAATPGLAADPRVLATIEHVVRSAKAAGISVSVCGDAAADEIVLPLLIGLGVRTFSVPAALVGRVSAWASDWDGDTCAALAAKSVRASGVVEVRELVRHARFS